MAFLEEHFPHGQQRYAGGQGDEEAWGIHFVVAVWRERGTANRGSQILPQVVMNPLLASDEHTRTLAGDAFDDPGLTRGEPCAEARHAARRARVDLSEVKQLVAPLKWRTLQIEAGVQARKGAAAWAEEGDRHEGAGPGGIRKSRKRVTRDSKALNHPDPKADSNLGTILCDLHI
ncbi:hypothetical protein [Pseudogemmobacter bohemicus]|uniref:hypothetical protein n=1 Tax=Pseudogemmobacter bohemicus TaxID=2250708 RepID=UPI000DD45179|nr:hypothetical protein [Pseudogemmobacter bohemicus]